MNSQLINLLLSILSGNFMYQYFYWAPQSFCTCWYLYASGSDREMFFRGISDYRTFQYFSWAFPFLEYLRDSSTMHWSLKGHNLFTIIAAPDHSTLTQCHNSPPEKQHFYSGPEYYLLDFLHWQLSVVCTCHPCVRSATSGISAEKSWNWTNKKTDEWFC